MKFAILVVLLILLIAAAAAVAYVRRAQSGTTRPSATTTGSAGPAGHNPMKQPPANSKTMTPEEIVAGMLDFDQAMHGQHAIKSLGAAATPALLAALNDPRFDLPYPKDHTRKFGMATDQYPIEFVLRALKPLHPQEAAARTIELLGHKDLGVRSHAVELLGRIASDEWRDPILALLASEDRYLRGGLIEALGAAGRHGHMAPAVREAVFSVLAESVKQPSVNEYSREALALPALDRERAAVILLSPEVLNPDRPDVADVIKALRRHLIPVELDRILELHRQLSAREEGDGRDRAIGACLDFMMHLEDARAESTIRADLDSPSLVVRDKAAHVLAERFGAGDALIVVDARKEIVGWAGLTEPQRLYFAAHTCMYEMEFSSLAQYFAEESGDQWADAQRA